MTELVFILASFVSVRQSRNHKKTEVFSPLKVRLRPTLVDGIVVKLWSNCGQNEYGRLASLVTEF